MLCDVPHPIDKPVPEATYHFGVNNHGITIFGVPYYYGSKVHLCVEHANILYKESHEEMKRSWM